MRWLKYVWRWYLARMRLDLAAVCEMSKGRGECDDFHDYPDNDPPAPMHFHQMRCRRCGKTFYI